MDTAEGEFFSFLHTEKKIDQTSPTFKIFFWKTL